MPPRFLLLISTLVLCSISVRADSIITGGGVSLTRNLADQFTGMGFGGNGFSVSAGARTNPFNHPALPCAFGCSPNTLLNLSAIAGFWTVGDITSGSMNINGTNYNFVTGGVGLPSLPNVWGTGSIEFTAGSVLIPNTNDPIITLTSTFTSSGGLSGQFTQTVCHPVYGCLNVPGSVNTGALFGVGNVTVTLKPSMSTPGQYVAERATYTFVQPTPEPTTLILLGSGVLGIIGARLRRRASTGAATVNHSEPKTLKKQTS